jgi:superoxide dismutase, Cu-Zn family
MSSDQRLAAWSQSNHTAHIIYSIILLTLVISVAALSFAQSKPPNQKAKPLRAHAEISGNGITGRATLVESESGTQKVVRITIRVKGDPKVLKPGLHGVHFHENGACEPPFTSAGGHFDPGPASNSDPDVNHPYHMGDLPNLRVNANGLGTLEAVTTRVTLSEGPLSIFDQNGTAIIIHANPDQGISGEPKSGVSGGPRIACGVIKKD